MSRVAKAKATLSGYQTPAEEREASDNKSVALAQPHRRGNPDVRMESPLWEACRRFQRGDDLYKAGEEYFEISANYKATIDAPGHNRGSAGEASTEELQIARALLAKDRYWKAVNVLRRAHSMAQGVVERVCYDLRPPSRSDEAPLEKGLYALAVHFRIIDLGINEGKLSEGR